MQDIAYTASERNSNGELHWSCLLGHKNPLATAKRYARDNEAQVFYTRDSSGQVTAWTKNENNRWFSF